MSGGFCGAFLPADFHSLNVSPQKFERKIPRFYGAILQACRGQVGIQARNGPIPVTKLGTGIHLVLSWFWPPTLLLFRN